MRTIASGVLAILATAGAGCDCDSQGRAALIVRNEGLHWATLTVTSYWTTTDSDGDEVEESDSISTELKPGREFTQTFSKLSSVTITVARLGDGVVVFREWYEWSEFEGPDNELTVIVHP